MSTVQAMLRPRCCKVTTAGGPQSSATKGKEELTDVGLEQEWKKSDDLIDSAVSSTGPRSTPKEGGQSARKVNRTKVTKVPTRTNVKKKGEASEVVSRRGKRCLSLIFTMPMDVLYEILLLLSPKDLLSLYKTNKQFIHVLGSPQAVFIWKTIRKAEGCPDPTPDISEPRWAMLIFGGTRCEICNAPNVQAVDFSLRRRICTSCKKKRLIVHSRFCKEFPDLSEDVLDLVPYTHIGGWAHGRPTTSKFYWDSDIETIAGMWAPLVGRAEKGTPGAQAGLNEYEGMRMDLVSHIIEKAVQASRWYSKRLRSQKKAKEDAAKSRRESIFRRFEELGYFRIDIETGIMYSSEVVQKKELTERIWQRIQPILEAKIQLAARNRIRVKRQEYLKSALEEYRRGLPPNAWISYPEPLEFLHQPELRNFLELEGSDEIFTSSWETKILPRLPHIAERWVKERQDNLRNLVLWGYATCSSDSKFEPLDLAIAVFGCTMPRCRCTAIPFHRNVPSVQLYGWGEAKFHLQHLLCILPEGQTAARALVSAAGLNPFNATVQQMDSIDALFHCEICFQMLGFCPAVYGWREAVRHSIIPIHRFGKKASWKILSAEQRESVAAIPCERDTCWSCNHCCINTDTRETLANVHDHLGAHHQIREPKEGVDFVLFPSERRSHPGRLIKDPNSITLDGVDPIDMAEAFQNLTYIMQYNLLL